MSSTSGCYNIIVYGHHVAFEYSRLVFSERAADSRESSCRPVPPEPVAQTRAGGGGRNEQIKGGRLKRLHGPGIRYIGRCNR